MEILAEDNSVFGCNHCNMELGTLHFIFENEVGAKHPCFGSATNLAVDYENKKISGVNQVQAEVPSMTEKNAVGETSSQEKVFWTDSDIKCLIEKYKEHKEKFERHPKKKVWDIISKELINYGIHKDGTKCDEKWRNLRKQYDKVKTENNKSGNANVTWKYYGDLDEIYRKDPRFSGAHTASSSSSGELKRPNTNTDITEEPKKSKFCPDEKKRSKAMSLKEFDRNIQKRHQEKMEMKKEMMEWFKKNYKGNGDNNK